MTKFLRNKTVLRFMLVYNKILPFPVLEQVIVILSIYGIV